MNLKLFEIELGQETKTAIVEKMKTALRQELPEASAFWVTLNPEILLQAGKNEVYRKILNSATLKINDGFGLQLLAFLKNKRIGQRLAGVDLAELVLGQARELNLKIGLAVNKSGLSFQEEIEAFLKRQKLENFSVFSQEKEFFLNGPIFPTDFLQSEVLLVGLGAPWQEEFIFWAIEKHVFPKLKLAIGVGGTFDFWTKKQKRAPLFLRKTGLEWLWRFFCQPKRFFRIWRATGVFFWKGVFT